MPSFRAEAAKQRVIDMTKEERAALLAFLNSLQEHWQGYPLP